MDSAWFQAFVARAHEQRSFRQLPSVREWIAAAPADAAAARGRKSGGARAVDVLVKRQHISARNDVRASANASGAGIVRDFPPGSSSLDDYNIYKDLCLHDQAAASLANYSQRRSGFTAAMGLLEGEAVTAFRAYLTDLSRAPHWLIAHFSEQQVKHEQTNHDKFVDDLIRIVAVALRTVGGDHEAEQSAESSVRELARRLSSKASVEEKHTLFTVFTFNRANSSDPVNYGIFYTTIHGRYRHNGKTEVLSYTTQTFSVVFTLLSGVVISNEALYNSVGTESVRDWLNSHHI